MQISKRTLGVVLACSLALNLAVLGAVGGFLLSGHSLLSTDNAGLSDMRGGKPMRGDGRRNGPPVLGAVLSGLDPDARRAILRDIRDQQKALGNPRAALTAIRTDLANALIADPMDRVVVERSLSRLGNDMARRSRVTNGVIVDWLETQTLADRSRIAESLLNPRKRDQR